MKIKIPKPCPEKWEKMTPEGAGRFCDTCCKVVVDFTNKTADEIRDFFAEQAGRRVCGHFRKSQLAPVPVVKGKRGMLLARFALALYFVFGSFLFLSSCTTAGEPEVAGDVEFVDTTQARKLDSARQADSAAKAKNP